MGIIAFLVANWEILSSIIGGVLLWHKDAILDKLNITLKKNEVKSSDVDVWEKRFNLQEANFDAYMKRKEQEDAQQEIRLTAQEVRIKAQDERIQALEIHDKAREVILTKSVQSEKQLGIEVNKLKEVVMKLTKEVQKLTSQLNYYREHTDIELPTDLQ